MPRKERCQRLVDEFGIARSRARAPSMIKQLTIHRGAQPLSRHATIMPQMCHDPRRIRESDQQLPQKILDFLARTLEPYYVERGQPLMNAAVSQVLLM
jgi:hypothetical protein